jgi:hypothetical protein
MGVWYPEGKPGKKKLKDVELDEEERRILAMLQGCNWRQTRGAACVDVPAKESLAVDDFFRKMISQEVFGTRLGPYTPPREGATTDYFEIALNDARVLGVIGGR